MAAEMSTGALGHGSLYKSDPPVSMLVTGIEGNFMKKAINLTTFTCERRGKIRQTIEEAKSQGKENCQGKINRKESRRGVVAEFLITLVI